MAPSSLMLSKMIFLLRALDSETTADSDSKESGAWLTVAGADDVDLTLPLGQTGECLAVLLLDRTIMWANFSGVICGFGAAR